MHSMQFYDAGKYYVMDLFLSVDYLEERIPCFFFFSINFSCGGREGRLDTFDKGVV